MPYNLNRQGFLRAVAVISGTLATGGIPRLEGREPTIEDFNQSLFERLASQDPVLEQVVIDVINDFTRVKMREDGFFRRILPRVEIEPEIPTVEFPEV